ncbi:hypothetical protein [Herbaspirillum sp. B65]|nr:hypothetical protein [Herbaspirillum sp. B65]
MWLVPRLASFREEHPEIELHRPCGTTGCSVWRR